MVQTNSYLSYAAFSYLSSVRTFDRECHEKEKKVEYIILKRNNHNNKIKKLKISHSTHGLSVTRYELK